MTTLGPDSNILDAKPINWRLIVYPLLAVVVLVVGGLGWYFYQENAQELSEAQAHDASLQAKTPEDLVKVADQFPGTTQGRVARLSAANAFFAKKNYDDAGKAYQQIINQTGTDAELRDAAQLGLASALDASGKSDDAIQAYLAVARRGKASPYAPFAYHSAAEIYAQKGDKENERIVLMQAASLSTDSPFVKEAQARLKSLEQPSMPGTPESAPAKAY